MSDNGNMGKRDIEIDKKNMMDDVLEENKRLQNWQITEIAKLCDRVKSIKHAFDYIGKNKNDQSMNSSDNSVALKKRPGKNQNLQNNNNNRNPPNLELKKQQDEIELLKKENSYFKKERKQCWEIMRMQNQVVEDITKQWEDFNGIIKEYRKKGVNRTNSLLQELLGKHFPFNNNDSDRENNSNSFPEISQQNNTSARSLANLTIKTKPNIIEKALISKSIQAETSKRSVAIQTFRGEDILKGEWAQMKKRQKRCMGKIESMVKQLSASVTVGATNRYKEIRFEEDDLYKEEILKKTGKDDKNALNFKINRINMNIEEKSDTGSSDEEEEGILDKNHSFRSSEGQTTFTCETMNCSNLNSEAKVRLSDTKTKFKQLKRS